MAPTTADIRKFLTELFSDEELTILCYDYFRDVYLDFALGMSKGQKIQRLIEYCDHREAIPNLLAAMAAERATLYAARFGAPVEAAVRRRTTPIGPRSAPGVHQPRARGHRVRAPAGGRSAGGRLARVDRRRTASCRARSGWPPSTGDSKASGVFVVALTPAAIEVDAGCRSETDIGHRIGAAARWCASSRWTWRPAMPRCCGAAISSSRFEADTRLDYRACWTGSTRPIRLSHLIHRLLCRNQPLPSHGSRTPRHQHARPCRPIPKTAKQRHNRPQPSAQTLPRLLTIESPIRLGAGARPGRRVPDGQRSAGGSRTHPTTNNRSIACSCRSSTSASIR